MDRVRVLCRDCETQNYFESRLQGEPAVFRIHATPGYSRTVIVGLTVRLRGN